MTITDRLRFPEGPISLPGGDLLVVEIAGQALTRVRRDGGVEVIAELDGGPNGAAKVGFAGDVLNTAIYLRRALGEGHEVAFVSMIGRDSLSDQMAAFIAEQGIATAHLARHPTRVPGLYTIATDTRPIGVEIGNRVTKSCLKWFWSFSNLFLGPSIPT